MVDLLEQVVVDVNLSCYSNNECFYRILGYTSYTFRYDCSYCRIFKCYTSSSDSTTGVELKIY